MATHYDRIPDHLKPKDFGTAQLFESSKFELLTRTWIGIPIIMHSIIIIAFSYFALQEIVLWKAAAVFLGGAVFWTFTEYWIHRYIYHVDTKKKWLLKVQHMGHGIHHQYPKDNTRFAMPPVPALIIVTIFFGIFWLIMGTYAFAFLPGFLFGYLSYVSLHYAQHAYKAPKWGPLNKLWKWHSLHHYKYPEDKAFGVTTRLWDFVFRSMPD